jgi:hypothetical protein
LKFGAGGVHDQLWQKSLWKEMWFLDLADSGGYGRGRRHLTAHFRCTKLAFQ